MRSLYWKIFFYFWFAVALTLAVSIVVSFYIATVRLQHAEDILPTTVGIQASGVLEREGVSGL